MPKKLTTKEFITKARMVHGDKFGYDRVEYKTAWEKVIITCQVHGDFLQAPANHLFGAKCLRCRQERTGKANSMSQDEFVTRSQSIHGSRYDYSKVQYVGILKPVEIICLKHGSFFQIPNTHINNHGCPKCGRESSKRKGGSGKPYANTEIFINKAHKVHGNLYDYSLVDYKTAHSEIKIICSRHGIFTQKPNVHLNGSGCRRCWLENLSKKLKDDTQSFIRKAQRVHKDQYDYSLVSYIDTKTKVKILCKSHGIFEQSPNSHLNGNRCEFCTREKQARQYAHTTEKFIELSQKIHKDRYDYSEVDYTQGRVKVKIICPLHGSFWQQAGGHLSGKGCPQCQLSYGERKIAAILESLEISFVIEKKFDDCRDEHRLSFDFYLEIGSVRFLIEYDGIQHFESVPFWGGEEGLRRTQHRDAIKTAFAASNGFHLIRIPYTDFANIESILTTEIQKHL